jgi:hypothetical protein
MAKRNYSKKSIKNNYKSRNLTRSRTNSINRRRNNRTRNNRSRNNRSRNNSNTRNITMKSKGGKGWLPWGKSKKNKPVPYNEDTKSNVGSNPLSRTSPLKYVQGSMSATKRQSDLVKILGQIPNNKDSMGRAKKDVAFKKNLWRNLKRNMIILAAANPKYLERSLNLDINRSSEIGDGDIKGSDLKDYLFLLKRMKNAGVEWNEDYSDNDGRMTENDRNINNKLNSMNFGQDSFLKRSRQGYVGKIQEERYRKNEERAVGSDETLKALAEQHDKAEIEKKEREIQMEGRKIGFSCLSVETRKRKLGNSNGFFNKTWKQMQIQIENNSNTEPNLLDCTTRIKYTLKETGENCQDIDEKSKARRKKYKNANSIPDGKTALPDELNYDEKGNFKKYFYLYDWDDEWIKGSVYLNCLIEGGKKVLEIRIPGRYYKMYEDHINTKIGGTESAQGEGVTSNKKTETDIKKVIQDIKNITNNPHLVITDERKGHILDIIPSQIKGKIEVKNSGFEKLKDAVDHPTTNLNTEKFATIIQGNLIDLINFINLPLRNIPLQGDGESFEKHGTNFIYKNSGILKEIKITKSEIMEGKFQDKAFHELEEQSIIKNMSKIIFFYLIMIGPKSFNTGYGGLRGNHFASTKKNFKKTRRKVMNKKISRKKR